MIKLGLTGGIGSGKTYISRIFRELGIPIYYADDEAKILMNTDLKLREEVIALFGEDAYLPDGKLNTAFVASKIFDNSPSDSYIDIPLEDVNSTKPPAPESLRERLNNLVHKAVYQHFDNWCVAQNELIVMMEAALLFESGGYRRFDKTILVTAPVSLKMKRLLERGFRSTGEIEARMKAQLSDTEKMGKADFILINDEKEAVLPQILTILDKVRS
ncbi:MAG: dephospho-CoA kinase [Bacteroidales bacterium]|nr:dephospho-CoA kinase [Bacteroidales bacterium]